MEVAEAQALDPSLGDKRPADDHQGDQAAKRQASGSVPTATEEQSNEGDKAIQGAESVGPVEPAEEITIKVSFGKAITTITRPATTTVAQLKEEIERETGVPKANQKLLFKGQLKDEQTLQQTGLKTGSKLMVIGNKPEDVKVANASKPDAAPSSWEAMPKKEPWSTLPQHKKILDKGKPDDGWIGIAGRQIPLRDDQTYIPGLLNNTGIKVRLTFRPEIGQIWIGSATHTQKIPYSSIAKIESQPIEDQPEYSIVRMQLGASSSSNYWLYFFPSQSVASVKMRILGVSALLE